MKFLPLLCLVVGLTACQDLGPARSAATATQDQGGSLAQGSCGGCHTVERYGLSSNRDAPAFAAIVNQPGLTAGTLSSWLRDAHNYPDEMRFQLGPDKADTHVAYLLTLKDPNYRPPT